MNRDNRYIPRVIENGEIPRPTPTRPPVDFSPREALYYNDHPDEIIEHFDRSEYRAVLRAIERHVVEWEGHQTPQQISGHFSTWFGGNVMTLEDFVFTSTFNARGHDQDGNLVTVHDNGHVMFAGGEPVVEFDKLRVRGCA
jgi:hypothetical protein